MAGDCDLCKRIAGIANNPNLIAELDSGYALLSFNQYYRGRTLFIAKACVPELHELEPETRTQFLTDMADVAEAVFRAVEPRKLNYELLGNSIAHLHWHLFPRYTDDPNPTRPVWENEAFLEAPRRTDIADVELAALRERIRDALADVQGAKP